jgi:hypothetical protein
MQICKTEMERCEQPAFAWKRDGVLRYLKGDDAQEWVVFLGRFTRLETQFLCCAGCVCICRVALEAAQLLAMARFAAVYFILMRNDKHDDQRTCHSDKPLPCVETHKRTFSLAGHTWQTPTFSQYSPVTVSYVR